MNGHEKPNTQPENKENFAETSEHKEIMENLLELDVLDAQMKQSLTDSNDNIKKLEAIGKRIQELGKIWSNDINFKQIETIYKDLLNDKEQMKDWNVDSSSYEIGKQLKEEIKKADIKSTKTENLSGKVKIEAQKLESIGIPIEYAILANKSEQAPTIIVFLQLHIDKNGLLSEDAKKSQELVDKYVESLLDNKISTDLHVEGVSQGIPIQNFLDSPRSNNIAGLRLAKTRKDLIIHGSESLGITKIGMVEIMQMQKERDVKGLRRILGSILFVHNMVTAAKKSSNMTMATIGIGHEKNIGQVIPDQSFFPVSEAIAFEGANVLIINTLPHGAEEKLK